MKCDACEKERDDVQEYSEDYHICKRCKPAVVFLENLFICAGVLMLLAMFAYDKGIFK